MDKPEIELDQDNILQLIHTADAMHVLLLSVRLSAKDRQLAIDVVEAYERQRFETVSQDTQQLLNTLPKVLR